MVNKYGYVKYKKLIRNKSKICKTTSMNHSVIQTQNKSFNCQLHLDFRNHLAVFKVVKFKSAPLIKWDGSNP